MKLIDNSSALQSLTFRASKKPLDGMAVVPLQSIVDGRGELTELWSTSWMRSKHVIKPEHIYQSATDYNVVKAWHLHRQHTDQFVVTRGKLQVMCADVRQDSPTFQRYNSYIVGLQQPMLIKIPPGIAHGWKALSIPEAIVINLQSHTYDAGDELRFAWDTILKGSWEPIFR